MASHAICSTGHLLHILRYLLNVDNISEKMKLYFSEDWVESNAAELRSNIDIASEKIIVILVQTLGQYTCELKSMLVENSQRGFNLYDTLVEEIDKLIDTLDDSVEGATEGGAVVGLPSPVRIDRNQR